MREPVRSKSTFSSPIRTGLGRTGPPASLPMRVSLLGVPARGAWLSGSRAGVQRMCGKEGRAEGRRRGGRGEGEAQALVGFMHLIQIVQDPELLSQS